LIKDIRELQPTDKILLDTNTCLFVYGHPNFRYKNRNSIKYVNCQNNFGKGNVFVCGPVLSEFINKIRDEMWKKWKEDENPHPNDKKAFRNSPYYKNNNIADLIAQYAIEMLNEIGCCNSNFDNALAFAFLNEFIKCKQDFNDIIIEEICKENALALVTDDSDFKNCSIPIFTVVE